MSTNRPAEHSARWFAALIVIGLTGCHHQPASWASVSTETGCTPQLLARTAAYDSTRVLALAGSYRLVQIDTARGWTDLFPSRSEWPRLALRAADSAQAHTVQSGMGRNVAVYRPIVGSTGVDQRGFSAENPQVYVDSRSLNYLTIQFTPRPMLDGPIMILPIERLGPWGFGGYFREGSLFVPAGRDGKPLGQRAGFYCAFRL